MGACLATCCGSYCGNACANCGEASRESRIPYLIVLFVGSVLGTVLRFWAEGFSADLYVTDVGICTSDKCYGFGAAYRVAFALFLFFAVHSIAMLSHATQSFHRRFWMLKIVMFLLFFFMGYWIPNSFFVDVFANVARFVSAVFLLLQIVVLIDFAYAVNEKLTSSGDEVSGGDYAVLGMSLVMLAGAITLLVFDFDWFAGDGCSNNKLILWTTVILSFVCLVISISAWCEHGALLPSTVIAAYTAYLAFSAMSSDPNDGCNTVNSDDTLQLVISFILGGFSICYASYTLSNSKSLFGDADTEELGMLPSREDPESGGSAGDAAPRASGADEPALSEEEWELIRSRNLRFHLILTAASCYLAMVLTNWGFLKPGHDADSETGYEMGAETLWIKAVTLWVTLLLYLWTLVAPQLMPDREW